MAAVTAAARALGFVRCGSVRLGPLPRGDFVRGWLAEGRAGEMGWLARRPEERLDPRVAFPWARSVILLTYPYRPPPPPPGDWRARLTGRIAAYAAGGDYHPELKGRLDRLVARLGTILPGARWLRGVDTAPLVERAWAARAGLGWIGKNTLLLHREAGSWFFLAELVTDALLDDVPLPADHCGTCRRCVDACPTGALEAGYTMDPRRCIAYLTIEHRSALPIALRPAMENWVFGCDVCQEVCPWNGEAGAADDATIARLHPHLPELLALDAAGFRARFAGTAIERTRRRGLLRNVAVALGNSGNPDAVPALAAALADPDALVRGHVAWALGRIGGAAARHALARARTRQQDPSVRAEIDAALDVA